MSAGEPTARHDLPSGTVTFLFTDVVGSARLWEEHAVEMHDALARHDEIVRHTIESRGGHVVKTTGDGTARGVCDSTRRDRCGRRRAMGVGT